MVLLLQLQYCSLQVLGLLCHRGLRRRRPGAATWGCASCALHEGFREWGARGASEPALHPGTRLLHLEGTPYPNGIQVPMALAVGLELCPAPSPTPNSVLFKPRPRF